MCGTVRRKRGKGSPKFPQRHGTNRRISINRTGQRNWTTRNNKTSESNRINPDFQDKPEKPYQLHKLDQQDDLRNTQQIREARFVLDNFRKTTVRIVVYVGVHAYLTASEWSGFGGLAGPAAGWIRRTLPALLDMVGLAYSLELPHLLDQADWTDWPDLPNPARPRWACWIRRTCGLARLAGRTSKFVDRPENIRSSDSCQVQACQYNL